MISTGCQRELFAQTYHTRSNKALKAYTEGKRAYEYLDFRTAEIKLLEALESDESFLEAYILLAELYYDRKRFPEAASKTVRLLKLTAGSIHLGTTILVYRNSIRGDTGRPWRL
jgi:Tfp pilus assembly protein PilF